MKQLIIIALLAVSVNHCVAQDNIIGTNAPQIVFQGGLHKIPEAAFYKGKILVLDFWATWCLPCIAEFPHLNELSKKYSNKDVVFAAMTDESPKTISAFFNRTQKVLNATVLCDTSKKTESQFNARSIPYCVIIGKDNTVKWAGSTDGLTASILEKITMNIPIESVIPVKKITKHANINQNPVFSFSVTKSDTNDVYRLSMGQVGSIVISFNISKTSISSCLENLTGLSKKTRILTNDTAQINQLINLSFNDADPSLFSDYHDVLLKNSTQKNLIIKLLGESLKFDASISVKNKKHYELTVIDSAKLHKFKSIQLMRSSVDADHFPDFETVGYDLKNMTINLESSFGQIITTNINDENRYDLSLDVSNILTLNKTLAFYGLKLIEVTGNIEFLNINFR